MKLKKILYLLVLTVLLFGINSNCFAAGAGVNSDPINVRATIRIVGSIFKTNDHGDGLLGAKFRIHDLNNTFSYYAEDENNGLYGLGYSSTDITGELDSSTFTNKRVTLNSIIGMFPPKIQNDLNTFLKTRSTNHLGSDYYYLNNNTIGFAIPFFIEEETAPSGYIVGEKIVLPIIVMGTLNGDNVELILQTDDPYLYLKYNKNLDYNDFSRYIMSHSFENDLVDCRNLNFHSNVLDNIDLDYDPIILFNEKGNVSLKINNYVNNLSKYTTTRGKTLNYRIEVVNSGSAASTNNVIVTNVPKELVYVKGSASDGGIYNKTNHTITWRINSIKANSTVSFRYFATVPKDAMTGIEFIGKSTISSQEIGEIQSRETNVSLLNNPETAAPIAVLVIIVSMLGIMTVIKNHKKEQEVN